MKLVRLARKRWEVLAVCDDRGRCLVLDFLAGLAGTTYQIAAKQMSRLLDVQVPANGPPKTEPLCKPMGDGLYEFRKQPKGKKLRVFWFYGDGAVIVCAVAFIKAEKTPRSKVAQARLLQERYREAKRARKVEIVDIEETEWKITWTS
jgi:phage-related protein